jgi:hypothetical protein
MHGGPERHRLLKSNTKVFRSTIRTLIREQQHRIYAASNIALPWVIVDRDQFKKILEESYNEPKMM